MKADNGVIGGHKKHSSRQRRNKPPLVNFQAELTRKLDSRFEAALFFLGVVSRDIR
jgi:hypothetical protein